MQESPDLSKIVNLIMQNPSLIEQISSLAKNNSVLDEISEEKATEEDQTLATETVLHPKQSTVRHANRRELLNAMKPYLSENRRTAIDSMSSILEVIDMMKNKGGE